MARKRPSKSNGSLRLHDQAEAEAEDQPDQVVPPAPSGQINDPQGTFTPGQVNEKSKPMASRAKLESIADQIKSIVGKSNDGIVAVGKILNDFQNHYHDLSFSKLVVSTLEWNRSQAYRYLRVHQHFKDCTTLVQFDTSALYALSEPSCPVAARAEALGMVSDSTEEYISNALARKIVAKYATPIKKKPPTKSLTINKADWDRAAKERKVEVEAEKIIAIFKDLNIDLVMEEEAK